MRRNLNITNAEGANDALVVNALGGNDTVTAATLPAGIIKLTIDGGAGNDTLRGSQGADVFLGGDGNDVVAGAAGNDVAFLGAQADLFIWNPGDGSDVVEGQAGLDTLRFNGSAGSENFDISANGGRGRLFRDIANILMDFDDIETMDLNVLSGTDNIVVGDLTGTDLTSIQIDLAGVLGGAASDAEVDTVTVNGTQGDDVITVAPGGTEVVVGGIAAQVRVDHAGATDRLTINLLGGNDVINASAMADEMQLTFLGGLGADVVIGGAGNDVVMGGDGDDTALLGAGNDRLVWNPGDDNDTGEGQAGIDTLQFNGANIGENIDIAANGGRALFFRNVASVLMDLNDMEVIEFNALGGPDTITIHDLSGTDVTSVELDLAGTFGGTAGDAQVDSLFVEGTNGGDLMSLTLNGTEAVLNGLPAQVRVDHAETTDQLSILALGGNDRLDASTLPSGQIGLLFNGGAGNDTVKSGGGNDTLDGQSESDTADYGAKTAGVSVALNGAVPVNVFAGGVAEDLIMNFENVLGGSGNDTLTGDGLANVLGGSGGLDILDGGLGNDTLRGGAGKDTLDGGAGTDAGNYSDKTSAVAVTLNGATQANVSVGGVVEDVIRNVEFLFGGSGNDTLFGDGAANYFAGGAGGDRLNGSAGGDTLIGATGNDTLTGAAGKDVLYGGAGIDAANYSDKTAAVSIALNGATAVNVLVGGAIEDTVQNVEYLFGGMGNDTFTGDGFANFLTGAAGADSLNGGAGNDTLSGGAGKDRLAGGTNADQFRFNAVADSAAGPNRDVITDFQVGIDDMNLAAIDGNTNLAGKQNLFFKAGGFTGVAGQVIVGQAGATTFVFADVNGDAVQDMTIELTGNKALTAGDFIFV